MKLQQPILKAFLLGATVNSLGFVTLVGDAAAQTAPRIQKVDVSGSLSAPATAPSVNAPVAQVPAAGEVSPAVAANVSTEVQILSDGCPRCNDCRSVCSRC
jgi:hypothetical protein